MKEILWLTMDSPRENYDETHDFQGQEYRIIKLGVNFDQQILIDLCKQYDGKVDIIALSGLPNKTKINGKVHIHYQYQEVLDIVKETPVVDGQNFRELYIPWILKKIVSENQSFFHEKKVGLFCGAVQNNYIDAFEQIDKDFLSADPYFLFKMPLLLKGREKLNSFLSRTIPVIKTIPLYKIKRKEFKTAHLNKSFLMKKFTECDIFFFNHTQFKMIDTDILIGKTVFFDAISEEEILELKNRGVKNIISLYPNTQESLKITNFTLLEAILLAENGEKNFLELKDLIDIIDSNKLYYNVPQIENSDINRFAFLVHPLQKNDLLKVKGVKWLKAVPKSNTFLEKAGKLIPGFKLGKITDITSIHNGVKTEGYIYVIPETPKILLEENPDEFYQKVIKIIKKAQKNDCKLFGLGAYTKIVGDAGVTINQLSPIPVTTGNSLSSASTIWAANYATQKMGFVDVKNEQYQGCAMVIGATGSIGAVTSKIIASKWSKVILVAPRGHKLMSLRDEVLKIAPHTEVIYSTKADNHITDADLIITTTSNQGKSLIDISKVKPGAVICDVSRPFDISEKQAITRPDVLVIASGEVELPGEVNITCDIGLHGTTVYACLAETALLSLENRFESFSLSRNLEYEKVKEIDRLSRKHGLRLSAIMGHTDEITDIDINLCKENALKERAALK